MMYAVMLVTLIALLTGNFISLSQTQRELQQRDFQQSRLIKNLESALQIAQTLPIEKEAIIFDLFGNGNDSIKIEQSNWGLFPRTKISAWIHTGKYVDSLSKHFLMGVPLQNEFASAIYLCDGLGSLSVCGNTLIKGKAYLPKGGVKAGIIANRYFERDNFIDGTIAISQSNLPGLSYELLQQLRPIIELAGNGEYQDTLIHSFAHSAMVIKGKSFYLDKVFWRGNIVLIAEDSVWISSNANIKDILIFSPKIRFRSDFSGNLQAFASEEIIVEQKVFLAYPSVLALLENSDVKTKIVVDTLSQIDGLILAQNNKQTKEKPSVRLAPKSLLRGQVYVEGFLEANGAIYGNASCEKFVLKLSAYTENFLLDAIFDFTKLPSIYLQPPILKNSKNKFQIIQYLQ